MAEMAVNSQVPWRFSLSPTLQDNDYFEQEQSGIFQNLEKLIASAVSICRLNGSLQCQIGGLITVIEELQRLLRHSFSEIKRLEKTVEHQKRNSNSRISNLHKQFEELESSVAASKCKSSDMLAQLPLSHDELTPRSSSNSEMFISQGGEDIGQAVEEVHNNISLVDESYGNEESDNNVDEQVDEMEIPKVVFVPDCETAGLFLGEGTQLQDEGENSERQVECKGDDGENELEDHSQESITTLSSDQTAEFSSNETSDISEEIIAVPKKLRSSKIDSKSLNDDVTIKSMKTRSERQVKILRVNSKSSISKGNLQFIDNLPPVKQRETRPKHCQDNGYTIEDERIDQIRTKTASDKKKGRPRKETSEKNKFHLSTKGNTLLKEVEKEFVVASPASQRKGRPLDTCINLEFLLMVNQVMSELVSDEDREDAALDNVNVYQRKHVVNLAKLYRLRVRMAGKCEGELPVLLMKGRESCMPKPGEVDSLLSVVSEKQAGMLKKSGSKHKIDTNSSHNKNMRSKLKKRSV